MQHTHKTLRRIGIIGDIHAESLLLANTLEFLVRQKPDKILAVGDIVDGRDNVNHCCALLKKHKVATVRGNHERWFLENDMRVLPEASLQSDVNSDSVQYLESLPITQQFQTSSGKLLLCHGLLEHDMATLRPDDTDYALESNFELRRLLDLGQFRFVVNGHSHQRMVRTLEDVTIINAGTLKHNHHPCFGWVDFELRQVMFYSFNKTKIVQDECIAF